MSAGDFVSVPVPCPSCGETYLETTENYDPERIANGTMFRFVRKYGPDGYNWSLPFDENSVGEAVECPGCGNSMCGFDSKINVQGGAEDAQEAHALKDAGSIPAPATISKEVGHGTKEEGKKESPGSKDKEVKPNDAHVCAECGKVCTNAGALSEHVKKKHGGK